MASKQKQVILHIGLTKTASTFLQKQIFSKLEDVYFSGINSQNFGKDCFNELHSLKDIDYDISLDSELKKEQIAEFISNNPNSTILYSNENLAGKGLNSFENSKQNAKILNKLFPNAKIFFIFRRQDNWISSYHNETFIKKGIPLSINEFIRMQGFISNANLDWLRIYKIFAETFGEENILALPYELLKEDKDKFLGKFYEFSNIKYYFPEENTYENISRKTKSKNKADLFSQIVNDFYGFIIKQIPTSILRKIRDLIGTRLKTIIRSAFSSVTPPDESMSEETRHQIIKHYQTSNTELAKITGIDLSKYGYYTYSCTSKSV